ncbi:MAG: SIMPL domain-containing protein [Candidatus Margulisbacteria bacterium]|nr:SIMPL domain-containing protein [Candidatus Margulisiibacteriota bacterium]
MLRKFIEKPATEPLDFSRGKRRGFQIIRKPRSLFAGFLILLLFFPSQVAFAESDSPQIIITGNGIVKAEADIAYISITVERTELAATEAQKIAAKKMNNVLASLKKMGIPKDKIETTDFDLRAKYEYQGGKRVFIGYTASNQIRVTLDDLDQLGKTIDAAIAGGATNVDNVRFSVKNSAPHKKTALEKAFRAAKEKAEILTKASGLKLIKILRIQEAQAQVIDGGLRAFKSEGEALNTPIIPGKIEVQGNLTVVYECD